MRMPSSRKCRPVRSSAFSTGNLFRQWGQMAPLLYRALDAAQMTPEKALFLGTQLWGASSVQVSGRGKLTEVCSFRSRPESGIEGTHISIPGLECVRGEQIPPRSGSNPDMAARNAREGAKLSGSALVVPGISPMTAIWTAPDDVICTSICRASLRTWRTKKVSTTICTHIQNRWVWRWGGRFRNVAKASVMCAV